jgi:hypothetical protein
MLWFLSRFVYEHICSMVRNLTWCVFNVIVPRLMYGDTPPLPCMSSWCDASLIKHRDSFAFTFTFKILSAYLHINPPSAGWYARKLTCDLTSIAVYVHQVSCLPQCLTYSTSHHWKDYMLHYIYLHFILA